jgi:RNA polymerase sigma-70 factor (ECF subfamily)
MTQGDRAALAVLYARHVQGLLAIAHSILREQQEAEDVIHEVFLEVWRHCGDYSRARGSVRAWLSTRTRSRALDRWRSGARHRNATNQVAGGPDSGADNLHDQSGTSSGDQHRLPAALAQIPGPLQHVIQLAYFEGLSTVEISSRLGIPTGTVKSRTHTAIKTLRNVLGVRDE